MILNIIQTMKTIDSKYIGISLIISILFIYFPTTKTTSCFTKPFPYLLGGTVGDTYIYSMDIGKSSGKFIAGGKTFDSSLAY
jgi:hypothetical protein